MLFARSQQGLDFLVSSDESITYIEGGEQGDADLLSEVMPEERGPGKLVNAKKKMSELVVFNQKKKTTTTTKKCTLPCCGMSSASGGH
jgi:hypothetical protein